MPTELSSSQMEETHASERVERARDRLAGVNGESRSPLHAALLTGGQDPHYAVGLATALMNQRVVLDVIGSDELDVPVFHAGPQARFLNLHGAQSRASRATRVVRILAFYARLFRYTLTAKPRIFHILWNNKLQHFDRTLLMLFYRLLRKRVVLTAHNVNAGKRDGSDSWLNRLTLKSQYGLANHLFVHTKKMMDELVDDFAVRAEKVTIIPYGVNNVIPYTGLTTDEARRQLELSPSERVLLYFGAIKMYKGLEYLLNAFQQVASEGNYRLIIAGERKKGHEEYWHSIERAIESHPSRDKIMQKIEFIPDAETEMYFKAADVAVLPYTDIFQSGILFVAYNYGTPVIATDVGSFADDVVEGKTGFVCKPRNPEDLARTIQRYFNSDLFKELVYRREEIRDFVISGHSWDTVAGLTRDVYSQLLGPNS